MIYEPPAIYGIIGHPVAHSLSPVMQNAAFKALEVNAVYKLFPLVDLEELKLFMEDLKEENNPIFGLNVTVPYKQDVLPYLDTIDPLAEKIGAVNTLVIDHQRKIHGFNTDGPGFLSHLTELNVDLRTKRVAILGAGGTTRAIISVLCLLPNGPERITLYNRTRGNAEILVKEIGKNINTDIVTVVDEPEDLNVELADLLINTTNIGMKADDPLLIDPESLHKDMLVYDVIYDPSETKLLEQARLRKARTANGLGMLFYQGVLAFWHWSEVELDESIKKIMRKSLEKAESWILIVYWVFLFFIGAMVGSFLNVCIVRLPLEKSIVFPGSHCVCRTPIAWYDNIPLVSWILLGGKCRACKAKISFRYWLVELLTGVTFFLFYRHYGMQAVLLPYLVMVSGFIVATFVDFEHRIIPDEVSIGGMITGVVFSLIIPQLHGTQSPFLGVGFSILGLLVGGGAIYLMGMIGDFVFKKETMGGGDVKLMAMVGSFMGWKLALLTFFLAPFFGAGFGIVEKIRTKDSTIAYGPFLIMGALVSLFWGDKIINFLLAGGIYHL